MNLCTIFAYGIQNTSHIDTNNNDSLAHRQTHFTIYFYGELITLWIIPIQSFQLKNGRKNGNLWRLILCEHIFSCMIQIRMANNFIPLLPKPFHSSHSFCLLARSYVLSLSFALKQIDVFASHLTRQENTIDAFDYRRVSLQ